MRSTRCSAVLSNMTISIVVLAVLLAVPPPSMAKRFDCQMFCRTTGFSGMVGGCRCSFTLFTAKRSTRDHTSIPEESSSPYADGQQYPRAQDFSLGDLLRMAREIHESQSTEEVETAAAGSSRQEPAVLSRGMPQNHPAQTLVKSAAANSGSSSGHPRSRLGRSPSQYVVKRREFEQDLDNGDTSDYLRLPY